ncbi:MAG: YraN family protein [Pseudomonadota bacterium]
MAFNTDLKGKIAEFYAIFILICKGYKIINVRYKTSFGEIDIIARKKIEIIFVEVKYRKTLIAALDTIDSKKIHRMNNTALIYLQKHNKYNNMDFRFDAFMIYNLFYFKHYKNFQITSC